MDINLDFDGTNNPLITDDFSLFLQEVELAIKIIEGTIWNKPLGLDINTYVFNKFISAFAMRTEVKSFIEKECERASMFNWDVNVQVKKEADAEYILISMSIYKTEEDLQITKFIIS